MDTMLCDEIFDIAKDFRVAILKAAEEIRGAITPVLKAWFLWQFYCQLKELERQRNAK